MSTDALPLEVSQMLDAIDAVDPTIAVVIAIIVPLSFHSLMSLFYSENKYSLSSWCFAVFRYVNQRAILIALVNLIVTLWLCLNQFSFCYSTMSFGSDISYYMKVDLPAYDQYDAINTAVSRTSFNHYFVGSRSKRMNRKLGGTSSSFTIVYHTENFNELLTMEELFSICITERNIRANVDCLYDDEYVSIIPSIFDPSSCQVIAQPSAVFASLTSYESQIYFQDGINMNNPSSKIVISGTKAGTCEHNTPSEMSKLLNEQTYGNIQVTYADSSLLQAEFIDGIFNATYLSLIGMAISFGFFIVWIRGIICGVATIYSLLVAVIAAAGTLPTWEYGSFSAFNVMCVFILVGVGANSVLLFDSSWKRFVGPGQAATPTDLYNAYKCMGTATLFTVCAACLSLYSKLASPVIVISQLGAFMGTAVVVFYAEFHFLIIPLWVATNRVRVPMMIHDHVENMQQRMGNRFTGNNGEVPPSSVSNNNTNIEKCADITRQDKGGEVIDLKEPIDAAAVIVFNQDNSAMDAAGMAAPENGRDSIHSLGDSANFSRSIIYGAYDEAEDVNDLAADENQPMWLREYVLYCCRFMATATMFRISVLLLSLLGLLAIVYFVTAGYVIDFGIPQLVTPTSNLGECLTIVKEYKSTLLGSAGGGGGGGGDDTPAPSPFPSLAPSPAPSRIPTEQPTFRPIARPTFAPTPGFPTFIPTPEPSFNPFRHPTPAPTFPATPEPTAQPTTLEPTLQPTHFPTAHVSPAPVAVAYSSYVVTGCWGITYSKQYKDSSVQPDWDMTSFQNYINNGNFFNDAQNLCDHVQLNREYLNVDPVWVVERDCLYYQLLALLPVDVLKLSETSVGTNKNTNIDAPDYTINDGLMYWASLSPVSGVSSLLTHPEVAREMMDRWEDVFAKAGSYSKSAITSQDNLHKSVISNVESKNMEDISILVGSDAFTLPLLASEVILSIEIAGIVSIAGFIVLIFVFTWDVGMMLVGTLVMTIILAMTFCLHLYFASNVVDLLDVVVLIAIIGMIVDFPIHMMQHHLQHVKEERKKLELNVPLLENAAEGNNGNNGNLDNDDVNANNNTDVPSPQPVKDRATRFYISKSLVAPMLASIMVAAPLLFATLQLLKKTGQYIIIMVIVSYFVTCTIFPWLLALPYETNILSYLGKKIRALYYGDDDENGHYYDGTPGESNSTPYISLPNEVEEYFTENNAENNADEQTVDISSNFTTEAAPSDAEAEFHV